MRNSILIAFLFLSWTAHSQSGTVVLTESVARAVLKDLAELDMRRKASVSDSLSIQQLTVAYFYKDSANKALARSVTLCEGIVADKDGLLALAEAKAKQQGKEIRRQKRLRWLFLIGGGLALVLTH